MWRNSSRRSQSPSHSPTPVIRFSSNQDLSDTQDPDWLEAQLEQARLQRATFYRRLQSAGRYRRDDDPLALHKPRRSPEVDVASDRSPDFEPHTSWRFYTSFDNGEWQRHAVPVFKDKDAEDIACLNGISRTKRLEGSSRTSCHAAESALRRNRETRSSASDLYQRRTATRADNLLRPSSFSNAWRTSNSVESFRGPIVEEVPDPERAERISPDVRSVDLYREQNSVSPETPERIDAWYNLAKYAGLLREESSPPKRTTPRELSGSVAIDGVEVPCYDRIIVPTKYKNTATGSPVTPEVVGLKSIRGDSCSGGKATSENSIAVNGSVCWEKSNREVNGNEGVRCMTGQGRRLEVKARESRSRREFQGHSERLRTRASSESRLSVSSLQDEPRPSLRVGIDNGRPRGNTMTRTRSKTIQVEGSSSARFEAPTRLVYRCLARSCDDISEKPATGRNWNELDGKRDRAITARVENFCEASKPAQLTEEKQTPQTATLTPETTTPAVQKRAEINSPDREHNLETPGGREQEEEDDVTSKAERQNQELTSEVVNGDLASEENISQDENKGVKFVSVFFAKINDSSNVGLVRGKNVLEPSRSVDDRIASGDPRHHTRARTKVKSAGSSSAKIVSNDEDDPWVVEMAVRD